MSDAAHDEMESLNLDELDVEALEQRLELAAAAPTDCITKIACPGNGSRPPICDYNLSWECNG